MAHNLMERVLNPFTNGHNPQAIANGMSQEHKARIAETAVSWAYYIGKQKAPLIIKSKQPDFNAISNWYQKIINDSVDFTFGNGLTFTAEDEAAQKIITDAWADNPSLRFSFGQFLQELGQSGANGRNAFIRIFINEDSSQTMKIVNPDSVEIITPANDIDKVSEYLILWQSGDDAMRQRIYQEEAGAAFWLIQMQRFTGGGMTGWVNEGEAEVWDFPFPPMFHCKNLPLASSVWGQPDVWSTSLQDTYNRVSANMSKVEMYNSAPQGFLRGHIGDSLKKDSAAFLPLADNGEAFYLTLDGDMSLSKNFKEDMLDDLMTTTGTVKLTSDNLGIGAASGFALRILLSPAIAKAKRKRQPYGSLFEQVNQALLEINGLQPVKVVNVWGDIIPENQAEQVALYVSLLTQGRDPLAAAEFVGIDPDMAEKLAATAVTIPSSVSPIDAILNGAS